MSSILCVIHTGDNLTGSGEGDDEVIRVNLDKVPSQYQKIVITVTIHDAGIEIKILDRLEMPSSGLSMKTRCKKSQDTISLKTIR